jgi:hypothetical protein
MHVMRRFVQLSSGERRLVVEAAILLLFVRGWLRVASVDRLEKWARPAVGEPRPVADIVWAVSACARRIPGTRCLPVALVLQRLLRAAGHRSEFHIGVAHDAGRQLAAHAWVVRDGAILVGGDTQTAYAPLLSWK